MQIHHQMSLLIQPDLTLNFNNIQIGKRKLTFDEHLTVHLTAIWRRFDEHLTTK
jgi:hypothetical protein